MNFKSPFLQLFLVVGILVGWFAIAGQLYLILATSDDPAWLSLIRFFSFFTILTNTLVALCFSVLWLKPASKWGSFFSNPGTLTAITVYITVVGLVYNTTLRQLWHPEGLQYVVDELLHSVIPLLVILFWLLFVPKTNLRLRGILPWLWYPFIYLIYILVRGALSNAYPYPFMDVTTLGYGRVLFNSVCVTLAFLGISLLFVGFALWCQKRLK